MMKVAISSCLLGQKVRFDGGHKRDDFTSDILSEYVEYVPFCPEVLAFGTPRPSIRLVQTKEGMQARSNKDASDVTNALQEVARSETLRIAKEPLRGIIFKSKSPSCGFGSAKVYLENGFAQGKGDGLMVTQCKAIFGNVPIEEEGRLQDAWLKENFMMQLFAYDAFENFKASQPSMSDLVQFHTRNKFLLQLKNETHYRTMGKLVGNQEGKTFEEIFDKYELLFKEAIAQKSSIGRTRNVLEHLAGFFKNELSSSEKQTLHEQIKEFVAQIVPLIVPISTLKLYAKKYDQAYVLNQSFLDPYPKELGLRSHISSNKP